MNAITSEGPSHNDRGTDREALPVSAGCTVSSENMQGPSDGIRFADYSDYSRAVREAQGMRLPFIYRDPLIGDE